MPADWLETIYHPVPQEGKGRAAHQKPQNPFGRCSGQRAPFLETTAPVPVGCTRTVKPPLYPPHAADDMRLKTELSLVLYRGFCPMMVCKLP
jgi:hypothetical protein